MTTPQPAKKQPSYRDIVVIGASAGGVTALMAFVKTLPPDFPAPVFVVLHVPADSPGVLPQMLNSVSALEVRHPHDGETVAAGTIYVAPPTTTCCWKMTGYS